MRINVLINFLIGSLVLLWFDGDSCDHPLLFFLPMPSTRPLVTLRQVRRLVHRLEYRMLRKASRKIKALQKVQAIQAASDAVDTQQKAEEQARWKKETARKIDTAVHYYNIVLSRCYAPLIMYTAKDGELLLKGISTELKSQ